MKRRVLITDHAWSDLDIETEELARAGATLEPAPSMRPADLIRSAAGVDAILTNWAKVCADVLDASPRLIIVARLGIGLDNIDVEHASRRGILVTNVPDYCIDEVADHTMALLLALARNVAHYDRDTRAERYGLRESPPMRRLAGRRLGLVGHGNIGRAVARRATAFGLHVAAATRRGPLAGAEDGVERLELDELLRTSDFVSLHCPATEQTRHLIDERALASMKPTAFLINTARGALVDHEALAAALGRGALAGAALDVQDPEPPDLARAPWNDPRVIVTPHAAFASVEAVESLRRRASRQVAAALSGDTPENVVNLRQLVR